MKVNKPKTNPVIASNLEGIKDAIKDGKKGFLVKPYDIKKYIKKINHITSMKDVSKFKREQIQYTCKNYDLKSISFSDYKLFKKLLN